MTLVLGVWTYFRVFLGRSAAVTLENVALRHQLDVLQRSTPRFRLRRRDRIFWVCLSRLWTNWRASLVLVRPATVVAWHRQGFRLYWRWKSRPRLPGRPPIDLEIRRLIRRMARENLTWGRLRRPSPRPSSTWRTFLEAHIGEIVAIDFFVVPTLTFHLLFGFLILRHDRRELVHRAAG
jgi:putative transposase